MQCLLWRFVGVRSLLIAPFKLLSEWTFFFHHNSSASLAVCCNGIISYLCFGYKE